MSNVRLRGLTAMRVWLDPDKVPPGLDRSEWWLPLSRAEKVQVRGRIGQQAGHSGRAGTPGSTPRGQPVNEEEFGGTL